MKIKRPFKFEKQIAMLKAGSHFPRAVTLSMVAAVVAATMAMPPAWAAAAGNDYEKLENKFFHHTYPKDTADARLDRLEKMVFGEAKEGADRDRLDSLLKLVPDGGDDDNEIAGQSTAGGGASAGRSAPPRKPSATASDTTRSNNTASTPRNSAADSREDEGTQYPAVSAIEKKLFGKEFNEEPVETRLTRLEKKTFGKQSASNDLSERTDALKAKTGIDIARHPAPGTDWNDEEEDDTDYPEPSSPVSRRVPGVSPRDSGMSFSGRNVGADLNKAFNRRGGTGYGGSGAYGMGSGGGSMSSGGSGAYGFGGGGSSSFGGGSSNYGGKSSFGNTPGNFGGPAANRLGGSPRGSVSSQSADEDDDDVAYAPPSTPSFQRRGGMPPVAPPVAPSRNAAAAQGAAGGLTLQLDGLESQVLGKTYQEPLIQRLDRLETIVFPGDKSARARTPAERVARLSSVLGNSSPLAQNQQQANQDLDGDGAADQMQQAGDPQIAQQMQQKSRGGLGKIINSLGNFLSGGMAVGSYPMASSNMVTDPSTGMLLDQYSGNLINPTTGQIVGRKAGFGYPTTVPNYGMNFNNGFSPYTSPYSNPMYSNPAYGIGGSGVRFGTGGMGGVRFGGGLWP